MRILAIDTALNACSVAVLEAGESAPLAFASVPMEKGHAEALLPLLKQTIDGLEGGFASLHRVAVTVGPGSLPASGLGCRLPEPWGWR